MVFDKMNKKEFVEYMAEEKGIKKVEALNIVNTFISTLLEVTANKTEVQMIGEFGTKIKLVEERVFCNPKDRSQSSTKPEHYKVVMKLGSKFQSTINE